EDLRRAAEAGTLQTLRGLSAKTEQLILEGIARLESAPQRMLLHRAEAAINGLIAALTETPGLHSIEPAGSFRRRRESIGDLDLLAETEDGPGLIERFTSLGVVDHVVNKGGYKAAVRLLRGPQADLMVMPPGTAGTYRIHFTGSKEHNVRLRERARDQGWSLSEKGFGASARTASPSRAIRRSSRRSPRRPRRTRSSVSLSSNRSCARTVARSRRRSPAHCRASSSSATCVATSTAIPTGPTVPSRSRSWPSSRVGAATPIRS
ncbi:MAG: hypothetical protein H0W22_00015, partial [Chloroflexi bacterium]|nr:hypothetical protein [Chloroflexota bacterium]